MNPEWLVEIINSVIILNKHGFFIKHGDNYSLSFSGNMVIKKTIEADNLMFENNEGV